MDLDLSVLDSLDWPLADAVDRGDSQHELTASQSIQPSATISPAELSFSFDDELALLQAGAEWDPPAVWTFNADAPSAGPVSDLHSLGHNLGSAFVHSPASYLQPGQQDYFEQLPLAAQPNFSSAPADSSLLGWPSAPAPAHVNLRRHSLPTDNDAHALILPSTHRHSVQGVRFCNDSRSPGSVAYASPLSSDPFAPLSRGLDPCARASPPRVLTPSRPLSIQVPPPSADLARHAQFVSSSSRAGTDLAPAPVIYSLPGGTSRRAGASDSSPNLEGANYRSCRPGMAHTPTYTLPSPALSSSSSMSSATSPASIYAFSPRLGSSSLGPPHARAHSAPSPAVLSAAAKRYKELPLPLQRPGPSLDYDPSSPPAQKTTFVLPSPPSTPRSARQRTASASAATTTAAAAAQLASPKTPKQKAPAKQRAVSQSSPMMTTPTTPKRQRSKSSDGASANATADTPSPSPAKKERRASDKPLAAGTLPRFRFVNFGEGDGDKLRKGVAPSGTTRRKN